MPSLLQVRALEVRRGITYPRRTYYQRSTGYVTDAQQRVLVLILLNRLPSKGSTNYRAVGAALAALETKRLVKPLYATGKRAPAALTRMGSTAASIFLEEARAKWPGASFDIWLNRTLGDVA